MYVTLGLHNHNKTTTIWFLVAHFLTKIKFTLEIESF